MRTGRLLGSWVTHPVTLLQIFDPELIDIVGDGFLWRGWVIRTIDGRAHENMQLWLVRPCADIDGPPLPPFKLDTLKVPVDTTTGAEQSTSERWLAQHPEAKTWTR